MTVTAPRSENDNVNPEEVLLNNDGTLQKFDWQQVSIFEETENELDMAMMMDSQHEYCFDIKKIDIIAEQKSCEEIEPWYQLSKLVMFHLMLISPKQNCLQQINLQ